MDLKALLMWPILGTFPIGKNPDGTVKKAPAILITIAVIIYFMVRKKR